MKDLLSNIIAYENGELSEDETIEFFQDLVNSGMAWTLQGSYGRMAMSLVDAGLITLPKRINGAWEEDAKGEA